MRAGSGSLVARFWLLHLQDRCGQPQTGHLPSVPVEYTVRQLAEMVRELTNTRAPLVERPLPEDDPKIRRPDITNARAKLGWEPVVGIREGLERTIAYFASLPAERMAPRE